MFTFSTFQMSLKMVLDDDDDKWPSDVSGIEKGTQFTQGKTIFYFMGFCITVLQLFCLWPKIRKNRKSFFPRKNLP